MMNRLNLLPTPWIVIPTSQGDRRVSIARYTIGKDTNSIFKYHAGKGMRLISLDSDSVPGEYWVNDRVLLVLEFDAFGIRPYPLDKTMGVELAFVEPL